VELEQFLEIIFLSEVAILLFLFRKKLSSMLIWIGLACYFGPMIFELIGILFTVNVFYTHIKYISYGKVLFTVRAQSCPQTVRAKNEGTYLG
jgi:hypothetical protein